VSAVTGFGLFVQLDELYVDGLVHITELGGEYFKFDEARQELRGERTGVRYAVGVRLRVQVSRVDLDGRKIDFRLVREPGAAATGRASRSGTTAVDELKAVKEADRVLKRAAKKAAVPPKLKHGHASALQPDKISAANRAQAVRAQRRGKRGR
jgi:ribonuclease R